MSRWLLVLALGGCDYVYSLDRPSFATGSDLTALRLDLSSDATPDTVVLDRRGKNRVHIIPNHALADFGMDMVTFDLDFRPLVAMVAQVEDDRFVSLFVAGERASQPAAALIHHENDGTFSPPLVLGVSDLPGPISHIANIAAAGVPGLRLGLVSGGRAWATRGEVLAATTIEMVEIDDADVDATITKGVGDTPLEVWVSSDDHVSLFSDQSTGWSETTRVEGRGGTYRLSSRNGNLGVGGRLHTFSIVCSEMCNVHWEATSSIENSGSADYPLEMSSVLGTEMAEISGAFGYTDLVVVGVEPDGDLVAQVLTDLAYDGSTFHWENMGMTRAYLDACITKENVATFSTSNVENMREDVVLFDRDGKAYASLQDNSCVPLPLDL